MADPKKRFESWIDEHFGKDSQRKEVEKSREKLAMAYSQVFNSEEGEAVLFDILNVCGFFNMSLETTEDLVRINVAKTILNRAGRWTGANTQRIAQAMLRLPVKL